MTIKFQCGEPVEPLDFYIFAQELTLELIYERPGNPHKKDAEVLFCCNIEDAEVYFI